MSDLIYLIKKEILVTIRVNTDYKYILGFIC